MERKFEGIVEKDDDLIVVGGFNAHYANQIIEKSKEPHILRWTPRDADERFTDLETLTKYFEDREPHLLLDIEKDEVGGAIWYGRKDPPIDVPPPVPVHTFAIRLYEGYAGRGLMKDFMRLSFSEFIGTRYFSAELPEFNGIWLGVDKDNHKAIRNYLKFGYETVGSYDDGARLVMVLSEAKVLGIIKGGWPSWLPPPQKLKSQ